MIIGNYHQIQLLPAQLQGKGEMKIIQLHKIFEQIKWSKQREIKHLKQMPPLVTNFLMHLKKLTIILPNTSKNTPTLSMVRGVGCTQPKEANIYWPLMWHTTNLYYSKMYKMCRQLQQNIIPFLSKSQYNKISALS